MEEIINHFFDPKNEYNNFELAITIFFFASMVIMVVTILVGPFFLLFSLTISKYFPLNFLVHFYFRLRTLSPAQKRILETKVLFYIRLNNQHQRFFEHRVATFLKKYRFQGMKNFVVDDEVKILIAACYVKLNFGQREYLSNAFQSIVVYPEEFYSPFTKREHVGEYNPKDEIVVLSWYHFKYGYEIENDNLNVGLHEFAHLLKHESLHSIDTFSNGFVKNLEEQKLMIEETEKMKRLYSENYLRKRAFRDSHEFFAVLIEHFFETPHQMKQLYPRLYLSTIKLLNYNDYLYAFEQP